MSVEQKAVRELQGEGLALEEIPTHSTQVARARELLEQVQVGGVTHPGGLLDAGEPGEVAPDMPLHLQIAEPEGVVVVR